MNKKQTPKRRLRVKEEEKYTKFQIAMQYFPDKSYATASRNLRYWIASDKALRDALHATGYRDRGKFMTEEQYQILIDHVGEPL